MSSSESYSLWFCPQGPLADRCQQEIDHFVDDDPRLPDAPSFLPHVTLLGGINQPLNTVLEITEHLAAQLPPIDLIVDKVDAGATFHQSVYILCQQTPELMQAGSAARQAFGIDDSTAKYMPHMSLVYSDVDQETRRAVAEEAQERLFSDRNGDPGLAVKQVRVESVAVWFTPAEDKSLKSWKAVAEFPLKGKS